MADVLSFVITCRELTDVNARTRNYVCLDLDLLRRLNNVLVRCIRHAFLFHAFIARQCNSRLSGGTVTQ